MPSSPASTATATRSPSSTSSSKAKTPAKPASSRPASSTRPKPKAPAKAPAKPAAQAAPAPAPVANEDLVYDADTGDIEDIEEAEDFSVGAEPSLDDLRALWEQVKAGKTGTAVLRGHSTATASAFKVAPRAKAAPAPAEQPPFEDDELVTVLLPNIYKRILAGEERKNHRLFVSGEVPSDRFNEDTGRRLPGTAITVLFTGGFARNVRYIVAKGWKKSVQFKSGEVMKVVANETPEIAFAKLCGVLPMPAQKQAAMLLASNLDDVLAEMDTAQIAEFARALTRRTEALQRTGILHSGSFTRESRELPTAVAAAG